MCKILLTAFALLGLVASKTMVSQQTFTSGSLGWGSMFSVDATATIDAGYHTAYDSGYGLKSNFALVNYYFESYGFELFATSVLSINFQVLDVYSINYNLDLVLLDVVPYRAVVAWTDPFAVLSGAVTGFDMQVSGEYELHFLEVNPNVNQNALVTAVSLVSYLENLIATPSTYLDFLPLAPSWSFTTNSFYFYDQDSNINLVSTLNSLGLDATAWYGEHQWWSLQTGNVLPHGF